MKEHIYAATLNELCDTARRFHSYGCLRTLMGQVLSKGLDADTQWYALRPADKSALQVAMESAKAAEQLASLEKCASALLNTLKPHGYWDTDQTQCKIFAKAVLDAQRR